MLTIEVLKQNTSLSGLTDLQLKAVAEMSKNDEDTVIGTKIGELHGQYDKDIFGITNIKKNDAEKSYDYAKRVIGDYKAKAESINSVKAELETAKSQVTDLQAKIAAGAGDETLRQQLKDTKAQVSQLQGQLQTKEADFTAKTTEFANSTKAIHVDYAFEAATAGLKFKTGITSPIQATLLKAAKAEVLTKGTPDLIDDGKGGKVLVLRGSDGNILNNPKHNLNPYTIKELVMETSLKDVIDGAIQQPGGGTNPPGSTTAPGNSGSIDLTGMKNQVDADSAIETYLLGNGLTRDSAEFASQSLQLRTENNIGQLPIR